MPPQTEYATATCTSAQPTSPPSITNVSVVADQGTLGLRPLVDAFTKLCETAQVLHNSPNGLRFQLNPFTGPATSQPESETTHSAVQATETLTVPMPPPATPGISSVG